MIPVITNAVTQAMSQVMIQSVMIGRVTESEIMVVIPSEREHRYPDEPRTVVIRGITRSIAARHHVGR